MQKHCSFPDCISIHKSKGAKPHPGLGRGESQAFPPTAKQAPISPKSVHRWPKEEQFFSIYDNKCSSVLTTNANENTGLVQKQRDSPPLH